MAGTHCLLKQKVLQVTVNAGALEMSRWRAMIYLSRHFLVWHWLEMEDPESSLGIWANLPVNRYCSTGTTILSAFWTPGLSIGWMMWGWRGGSGWGHFSRRQREGRGTLTRGIKQRLGKWASERFPLKVVKCIGDGLLIVIWEGLETSRR